MIGAQVTELTVGDEDDDDVGAGEGVGERDQRGAGDRGGVEVGLDEQELEVGLGGEGLCDVERRALAEVVDVGLVGEAETGDLGPAQAGGEGADLRDDPGGAAVGNFRSTGS